MATIVGTAMLEYEETEWVLACVSGAGQGFERHNTLRRQSVCSYNKVRLDMFINHLKENYNHPMMKPNTSFNILLETYILRAGDDDETCILT